MSWRNGWPLTVDLVTLFFTVLVVVDTSLRFDRIAGRMAGGALATRVDAWVHGDAHLPVLLPDSNAVPAEVEFEPPREQPELQPAADAVAVD